VLEDEIPAGGGHVRQPGRCGKSAIQGAGQASPLGGKIKAVLPVDRRMVLENRGVWHQRNRPGGHRLIVAPAVPAPAGRGKSQPRFGEGARIVGIIQPLGEEKFQAPGPGVGTAFLEQPSAKAFFAQIPGEKEVPFFLRLGRDHGQGLGGDSQADGPELCEIASGGATRVEQGNDAAGPAVRAGIAAGWGEEILQGDFRLGMQFPHEAGLGAPVELVGSRGDPAAVGMIQKGHGNVLADHPGKQEERPDFFRSENGGEQGTAEASPPSRAVPEQGLVAGLHHREIKGISVEFLQRTAEGLPSQPAFCPGNEGFEPRGVLKEPARGCFQAKVRPGGEKKNPHACSLTWALRSMACKDLGAKPLPFKGWFEGE